MAAVMLLRDVLDDIAARPSAHSSSHPRSAADHGSASSAIQYHRHFGHRALGPYVKQSESALLRLAILDLIKPSDNGTYMGHSQSMLLSALCLLVPVSPNIHPLFRIILRPLLGALPLYTPCQNFVQTWCKGWGRYKGTPVQKPLSDRVMTISLQVLGMYCLHAPPIEDKRSANVLCTHSMINVCFTLNCSDL
jgi:hypothetical protein